MILLEPWMAAISWVASAAVGSGSCYVAVRSYFRKRGEERDRETSERRDRETRLLKQIEEVRAAQARQEEAWRDEMRADMEKLRIRNGECDLKIQKLEDRVEQLEMENAVLRDENEKLRSLLDRRKTVMGDVLAGVERSGDKAA